MQSDEMIEAFEADGEDASAEGGEELSESLLEAVPAPGGGG